MVGFGWIYPHFLGHGPAIQYLWAAPLGLVPCPSVSVAIGLSLLFDRPMPKPAAFLLAGAGILNGLLGWHWLGVAIDTVLTVGSAMFTVLSAAGHPRRSSGGVPAKRDIQASRSAGDRESANRRA